MLKLICYLEKQIDRFYLILRSLSGSQSRQSSRSSICIFNVVGIALQIDKIFMISLYLGKILLFARCFRDSSLTSCDMKQSIVLIFRQGAQNTYSVSPTSKLKIRTLQDLDTGRANMEQTPNAKKPECNASWPQTEERH